MTQQLINTAFQLAIVFVIALIVWLLFGRKHAGFFKYVGLYAPTAKAMAWALALAVLMGGATIALFKFTALHELGAGPNTVAGMVREMGLGAETIGVIAVVAFLKTSLSEEILFRGLIAKRLIGAFGFAIGNTLHAILFGAIHLLIFVVPGGPAWDWGAAAAMLAISGGGGWVMAWVNERVGNGSIAPSWLMHGLANAAAYPVLAFL